MADKNDKGRGRSRHDPEDFPANPETPSRKRARSRRLILKSIVTGGAVTTTAKTLPEKWTRPIADSVLMPAHAQTSPPAEVDLTCLVEVLEVGIDPGGAAATPAFDPSGSPFAGGSSTTVENFLNDSDPSNEINILMGDVSATIDPAGAGDIRLELTPGGNFTLDSDPGPFEMAPNASGLADFGVVSGDLGPEDDGDLDEAVGNLELRFSAAGASDCVINFTFIEDDYLDG